MGGNIGFCQGFTLTSSATIESARIRTETTTDTSVSLSFFITKIKPTSIYDIDDLISSYGSYNLGHGLSWQIITFNNPKELQAGQYYFVGVSNNQDPFYVKDTGTNNLSNETLTLYSDTNTTTHPNDLRFILIGLNNQTRVVFDDVYPYEIVKSIVDVARERGIKIEYSSDSIVETGQEKVSYTFTNMFLSRAMEEALKLFPSSFYMYYDPGTTLIQVRNREDGVKRWRLIPSYIGKRGGVDKSN